MLTGARQETGAHREADGARRQEESSTWAGCLCDITVSADGYAAGHGQSEERPFGDDGGDGTGARPHAWMFDTPDENRAEIDRMTAAAAFVMGRNMFGPVRGAWDRPWNGWWGDDAPFHAPVFVLTHHAREPRPMHGGTTYHFVTDGIESALARARGAADGGDVAVQGARAPSTSTSRPA